MGVRDEKISVIAHRNDNCINTDVDVTSVYANRFQQLHVDCCRGNVRHTLFLRAAASFALSLLLIITTTLVPTNTQGWYGVRRANAAPAELIVGGGGGLVLVALSMGAGIALRANNGNVGGSLNVNGAFEDFRNWCSGVQSTAADVIESAGQTWTSVVDGVTKLDTSKVPDSVLSAVAEYGAVYNRGNGLEYGTVPSSIYLPAMAGSVENVGGTVGNCISTFTFELGDATRNALQAQAAEKPYFFAYARVIQTPMRGNQASVNAYVGMSANPLSYKLVNRVPAILSEDAAQNAWCEIVGGNTVTYGQSNVLSFTTGNIGLTGTDQYVYAYSGTKAIWFATNPVASATNIDAGVPSALDDARGAYEDNPSPETLQDYTDAVRGLNPQVTIVEEYPTTINNYTEYVTYEGMGEDAGGGTGTGADVTAADLQALQTQVTALRTDVDANASTIGALQATLQGLDSQVQTLTGDLTNLPQDMADLLGDGATIADVLATLQALMDSLATADDLAGEFQAIQDLLTTLSNIESRAERQQQQASLNADLDEIIDLLTSIDENLAAVLGDMANLDRSTGDLVDLTALENLAEGIYQAILGLEIPPATNVDLSTLEGIDAQILTELQALELPETYDYRTRLLNIQEDLDALYDDMQVWTLTLFDKLDAIIYDLEHLSFTNVNVTNPNMRRLTSDELSRYVDTSALDDALSRLMRKFPFSVINNITLILTALVRPAQTPVFDLPVPNPADPSNPYTVNVDLSDWDVVAAVGRVGITLWAIARVSRRTVSMWTREEGK